MRLELKRMTDQALQALHVLAAAGDRIPGRQLAEETQVTTSYLPQVMRPLIERGWVVSESGRSGGYRLVADLGTISMLDLITTVEGPIDDATCVLDRSSECPTKYCALHEPWTRARDALLSELAAIRLDSRHPGSLRAPNRRERGRETTVALSASETTPAGDGIAGNGVSSGAGGL